jgi:hypothetical protein
MPESAFSHTVQDKDLFWVQETLEDTSDTFVEGLLVPHAEGRTNCYVL